MSKEIEKEVKVEKKESEAKVKFRDLIERYKISNPVKYLGKKEELEKKLAAIN